MTCQTDIIRGLLKPPINNREKGLAVMGEQTNYPVAVRLVRWLGFQVAVPVMCGWAAGLLLAGAVGL